MTAHASPAHLIGRALPEYARYLSESDGQRLLVLGSLVAKRPDLTAMCAELDVQLVSVSSHHELPFRLHHNRPLAVLCDLPPESAAMSAALRCIATYDADLPVLLVGHDHAVTLGTIDAAEQLWGLSNVSAEAADALPHAIINLLFRTGCQSGALRLMAAE